jgi:hypothetical protein
VRDFALTIPGAAPLSESELTIVREICRFPQLAIKPGRSGDVGLLSAYEIGLLLPLVGGNGHSLALAQDVINTFSGDSVVSYRNDCPNRVQFPTRMLTVASGGLVLRPMGGLSSMAAEVVKLANVGVYGVSFTAVGPRMLAYINAAHADDSPGHYPTGQFDPISAANASFFTGYVPKMMTKATGADGRKPRLYPEDDLSTFGCCLIVDSDLPDGLVRKTIVNSLDSECDCMSDTRIVHPNESMAAIIGLECISKLCTGRTAWSYLPDANRANLANGGCGTEQSCSNFRRWHGVASVANRLRFFDYIEFARLCPGQSLDPQDGVDADDDPPASTLNTYLLMLVAVVLVGAGIYFGLKYAR